VVDLVFNYGIDLPAFAAFPLVDDVAGAGADLDGRDFGNFSRAA
jgi:hypothetical protein